MLLACCGDGKNQPPAGSTWSVVFEDLPGALISVWGTSATDIWTVGGDPDGAGPWVLHFDGERWTKIETGTVGDLWWVHGTPGGPVYAGGAGGQILRYVDGAFETMATPGTGTVFGLWAASADDFWAVGGDGGTPTGGFAWKLDGDAWVEAPGFPPEIVGEATVFKVWGRASDDVWLVGTGALVLHWNGDAFERVDIGMEPPRTLLTVNCDGPRCAAVGGFGTGVIFEENGDGWTETSPGLPAMLGVCLHGDGGFAAGEAAQILRRGESTWEIEDTGLVLFEIFHGCFVDPDGGAWAVGGQVVDLPLTDGMMVHFGEAVPAGEYAVE